MKPLVLCHLSVIEATPVQNQAAAQKLLQKLNQSERENRHYRGAKHRGKEREEAAVFTLDEWERSKAGSLKPVGATSAAHDTSRDEELARQLQNQLDLEDFHVGCFFSYAFALTLNKPTFYGSL